MKHISPVISVILFILSYIAVFAALYFVTFGMLFVVRFIILMVFGSIMMIAGKLIPKPVRPIAKTLLMLMVFAGIGLCIFGVVYMIQCILHADLTKLLRGFTMLMHGFGAFILSGSAMKYDL